jgi:hypothetical protein
MLYKILLSGFAGLSLIACGGTKSNPNTSANTNENVANIVSNSPADAKPEVSTNTASPNPANANNPTNEKPEKPAESTPKRLVFNKGTTNTIEYFDLAPGEGKKFVVGAKSGQNLVVANGGDGSQITLLTKGKTVDVTNEDGRLDATTIAGGDFIFEVKNTGKAKLKASINVIIENIGDD